MPRTVRLTQYELKMAASVGVSRHISCVAEGRPDADGYDGENGWHIHIEGAAGELAVAKAIGRYWDGSVDTFKGKGDIGDNIEVRTHHGHNGHLIVTQRDHEDHAYFLVTGTAPDYKVHGWLYGHEAMKDKWLRSFNGRPEIYFVPQSALHPLD